MASEKRFQISFGEVSQNLPALQIGIKIDLKNICFLGPQQLQKKLPASGTDVFWSCLKRYEIVTQKELQLSM